jgi:hypothetical protein
MPIPVLSADRTVVAKWGYGIEAPPDPAVASEAFDPAFDAVAAQNGEYRASLSTAARRAYDESLVGASPPDAAPSGVGGCRKGAETQFPYTLTQQNTAFLDGYGDLIWRLHRVSEVDVPNDVRSVKLHGEWHACMVSLGVDVSDAVYPVDPTTGEPGHSVGYFNMPSPAVALLYASSLDPSGGFLLTGDPAQNDVALADFDCRNETRYVARLTEVQTDLEQAFADKQRSELDKMRMAAS